MDVDEKVRKNITEIIHREGNKIGLTDYQKIQEAKIEILRLCSGGDVYVCRVDGILVSVQWREGCQSIKPFLAKGESRISVEKKKRRKKK